MPLYFFDIRDGDQLIKDEEGTSCADVGAARNEAVTSAKELLAEDLRKGEPARTHRAFEVTDEAGERVVTLSFAEAASMRIGRLR